MANHSLVILIYVGEQSGKKQFFRQMSSDLKMPKFATFPNSCQIQYAFKKMAYSM